ncbi:hypothetical protein GBAR_LOCUS18062 [Geodia barretti]|uniref:Uncharacterized protein n=1 Tax=Geodia barretti TaxID=519541 RepID=A0AA35WYZ1_GEOBA|nr:hypothetical protein GBAR_LOCUS18062 [Geodia barretti]
MCSCVTNKTVLYLYPSSSYTSGIDPAIAQLSSKAGSECAESPDLGTSTENNDRKVMST